MKVLFCLLMLIPAAVFGQYEGEYALGSAFVGWTVTILPGDRFHYEYWDDCSWGKVGEGWYHISPRMLSLHFEKDTSRKGNDTGNIEVRALAPKDSRACSIRISVIDKSDTQALICATITEIINGFNTGRGIVTDLDGNAVLTLPRADSNSMIEISYAGMKRIRTPIDLSKDYEIKAQLTGFPAEIIPAGTVYKMKIHNKTRKGFDLSVPGGFHYHKKPARIPPSQQLQLSDQIRQH